MFSWNSTTAAALIPPFLTPRSPSHLFSPHPPTMVSGALLTSRRATNDEEHDQIGSNGSTPPGASTPRPDPIDKRLPGILHSYFGQVRDSLLPRRKSSAVNSCPAPAPLQEKDPESARLRSNMLPSPTPSASSRHPSASQVTGETEKLTQGDFASPRNQATPPQTPRTRSQESKPTTSSLSHSTLASPTKPKESTESKESKESKAPAVGPPKGKLAVAISEGRDLRPSVDPYVVCQFQWAEYISEGPRHDTTKKDKQGAAGLAIRRTDSEMGKPMAIPMRSRQSSNNGTSSDPREDGTFKEVTDPKWEHDAIL